MEVAGSKGGGVGQTAKCQRVTGQEKRGERAGKDDKNGDWLRRRAAAVRLFARQVANESI